MYCVANLDLIHTPRAGRGIYMHIFTFISISLFNFLLHAFALPISFQVYDRLNVIGKVEDDTFLDSPSDDLDLVTFFSLLPLYFGSYFGSSINGYYMDST